MSELIGVTEAAKILGVSEVTVGRQAKAGKLQFLALINNKQYIFNRAYIQRVAVERAHRLQEAA